MRLTESEWRIMNLLWERSPASSREIHDQLEGEPSWAYDTVRTIMNRMVKKGVLAAEVHSNVTYYEPKLSRDQARRSALSWLAERAFEGTYGALMHFLVENEKLSSRDAEELADLLQRIREESAKND